MLTPQKQPSLTPFVQRRRGTTSRTAGVGELAKGLIGFHAKRRKSALEGVKDPKGLDATKAQRRPFLKSGFRGENGSFGAETAPARRIPRSVLSKSPL